MTAYEQALRNILKHIQDYLPPDGISENEAMCRIIGEVDPWPAEESSDFLYEAYKTLSAAHADLCVDLKGNRDIMKAQNDEIVRLRALAAALPVEPSDTVPIAEYRLMVARCIELGEKLVARAAPVEPTVPCPTCNAPCKTTIEPRGGDGQGWGTTDKERTRYRYAPPSGALAAAQAPAVLSGTTINKFERWADEQSMDLSEYEDRSYQSVETQAAWIKWQADKRAALAMKGAQQAPASEPSDAALLDWLDKHPNDVTYGDMTGEGPAWFRHWRERETRCSKAFDTLREAIEAAALAATPLQAPPAQPEEKS